MVVLREPRWGAISMDRSARRPGIIAPAARRTAGQMLGDSAAEHQATRRVSAALDWHEMEASREIELVFAPQEEGGFHVYAPDLPGLHTQGDTLEDAIANASEALELYVEGLRDEGGSLDAGVIRRKFPLPA